MDPQPPPFPVSNVQPLAPRRFSWFNPVLAPMLAQRRLAIALGVCGLLQLNLAIFHLPGMQCPMLRVTGIPCPGCGASRACAAFLIGDWGSYVRMHVFAPFFLIAIALFLTAGFAPRAFRTRLVTLSDRIERSAGLVNLLVAALILYWFVRLIYSRTDFIHAMKG